MRSTFCALLSLVLASAAGARPAHKKALADYLGPFLKPKLFDCKTCHVADQGKDEGEKPHNVFGTRVATMRKELRKAGKTADVPAALGALADEDADGDGVPNLIELLAGRAPGDRGDVPSTAEVATGRQTLVAFRKSQSGYPWRPFEKVVRPPVPAVKNSAWVRNPVDAFVAAEHETRGVKPRPEAPRAVLLRRVYLDLIGLPPTRDELHAFLNDTAPDAYEKVVDRLLDSPRYGERWGRHWMDVWRYSDWAGWTGGGQIRDSQPHIWRWRDWIIESINADKGYDRMIVEMLAADEVAPEDTQALRATGYLVRNYKMLSREMWMQDVVDHTSMAFLGLTMGCARCHDHMFDPVTQKEYYQLRAVFEPHQVRTDRLPHEADPKKDGLVRAYDANLTVPTYLYHRGDDRTPDKSAAVAPGVPQALGGVFKVEPVKLPAAAVAPERRPFVNGQLREAAANAVTQAMKAQEQAAKGSKEAREKAEHDLALAVARNEALLLVLKAEELEEAGKKDSEEWKQTATRAQVLQRKVAALEAKTAVGAAQQALTKAKAPPQQAAARKKLADAEASLKKAEEALTQPATTAFTPRPVTRYPDTSTGRRLALARWIAGKDNPLTARVAVNHLWLRHFGRALVPRVFDFGRNGQVPSHPALVDWLAAEFVDPQASGGRKPAGWTMKHLHRLMVTSSTYRTASTPDEASAAVDRDNVYLWRTTPRRVEAEVVRDCVFYVAGKLDLSTSGPDIDHNLGLTVPRRSLYFRHAAEKQMEFLKLFDAAAVTECYQRKESILPQQALALANSELTRRHARLLARDLAGKVGVDPAKFTAAAFEQVLSRPPTAEESTECVAFVRRQTERYAAQPKPGTSADGTQPAADPAVRACEQLAHVLLNHHDFVTIR